MSLPLSAYLQIADSAFPTGAFAYSSGLEALARAGRFPNLEALEDCLDAQARQAGSFDLAYVAAAHASGGEAELEVLGREWDATFWNRGIRTASLRQARALLDALAETFPHPGLDRLRRTRATAKKGAQEGGHEGTPEGSHYAPTLGRALAVLGASREQACCLYLHGLVRDQIAATVRLGLLGPRAAQALQARVLAAAAARLGDASCLPAPREARRTAPLIEAGQGSHDFLYSRLFQN